MHQRRSGSSTATTSSPSPAKRLIGGSSSSTPSLVRSATSRRRTLPIHLTPPPPSLSSSASLSGSLSFSPSPSFLARLGRKRQRHYNNNDSSSISFSSVYSTLKATLSASNNSDQDNISNISNVRSRFNKIARGAHVRRNIGNKLRQHRFDGNAVNLWMTVKGFLIFVATFMFVCAQWRQSSSSTMTADDLIAASNLMEEYARVRLKADSRLMIGTTTSQLKKQQQAYKPKSMTLMNENQHNADLQEPDTYDIFNCPHEPPHGYPYHWALVDSILKDWPIENIVSFPRTPNEQPPPREIYQGLCVFDYVDDYDKALRYRQAEVPFVVRNDKKVLQTVERWNDSIYLDWFLNLHPTADKAADLDLDSDRKIRQDKRGASKEQSRNNTYHVDYSSTNHFLLVDHFQHRNNKVWGSVLSSPKTTIVASQQSDQDATYDEWLDHAKIADDAAGSTQDVLGQHHSFLRLNSCTNRGKVPQECDPMSTYFLHEELPFFAEESFEASNKSASDVVPLEQRKESLYVVHDKSPNHPWHNKKGHFLHHQQHQEKPRGDLQCLFGMKGNIIENHFDENRNTIVGIRGQARYILSHPDQCHHLGLLYPKHNGKHNHHPYSRYSTINWTKSDAIDADILTTVLEEHPQLALAKGNEVVLQAGDVLYLPTFWFHWTVSLDMNIQCSRQSTPTQHHLPPIKACGY